MFELLKLNEVLKKKLFIKGCSGVALIEGTGILIENNIESNRSIEIQKNTNLCIEYFDLYTNKVIVQCNKGKANYLVSVTYDFLLNNCVMENRDTNRVIEAVYTVNNIKNVLDRTTLLYLLLAILAYICGWLVGKV